MSLPLYTPMTPHEMELVGAGAAAAADHADTPQETFEVQASPVPLPAHSLPKNLSGTEFDASASPTKLRDQPPAVGDPDSGSNNSEEPPARGNCIQRAVDSITSVIHRVIPPGGILSGAFTLASGSIGAGILGLPGATDSAGMAMAIIYLFVITFLTIFSMHLLGLVAEKTGIKTFEGIGRWLFPQGHYAFSYWIAFIRWFHCVGCCIGYVISIGNCFSPIFKEAHRRRPDDKAIAYFNSTSGNRLLTALVWLCIMLPLVIPKRVDSLRYASALAVAFMTYFVIVIIIHSCLNGLPVNRHHVFVSGRHGQVEEGDNIFLFRTGNPATTGIGMFMFAYVCQINALEVWADFDPKIRSVKNYTYSAIIGMLLCGILYVLVCVFGYFDFGSAKLQSNSILLMYNPLSEPYMMVAYVGVFLKLCVSYALMFLAARNSVYYVFGWQQKYGGARFKRRQLAKREADADCGADHEAKITGDVVEPYPAISNSDCEVSTPNKSAPSSAADTATDSLYVDNIPFWQHLLVVVVLATICMILGLFIPSINIVFGFAGSISGGFIAFIFPALYYMYAGDFTLAKVGYFKYILTYVLLFCGVVGVVFGTGATIYSTAGGD